MARKGGNPLCVGNKNSGRKTKIEEVKVVLEEAKEKITQEALIALANNKVYQILQEANSLKDIQAMGLPITLKGMTDKKTIDGNIKISDILDKLNE